jgi:hypothetical protein
MRLEVNDPAFMPLYARQERALEAAFLAALKLYGCVGCARQALAQRLRLMARTAEQEITGPQGKEDDPVPEERVGIRRTCPSCQTPPPEGAMRFFKHGTDELK